MFPGYRSWLALCAAAFIALPAAPASASVLTTSTTLASCQAAGGTAFDCTDTGYLSTTLATATTSFIGGTIAGADPGLASFVTAFDNWNAANGDLWTLAIGGWLDVALNVSWGLGGGGNAAGINPIIVTLGNFTQAAGGPPWTNWPGPRPFSPTTRPPPAASPTRWSRWTPTR